MSLLMYPHTLFLSASVSRALRRATLGSLAAVPCRSRHEGGATKPLRVASHSPRHLRFSRRRKSMLFLSMKVASPPPVHRPSPHRRIDPFFFDSDSRVCLRRTRGYTTSFVVNRPRGRFSFDCSSNSSHGLASSCCKSNRYRSPSHLVRAPRFRISTAN